MPFTFRKFSRSELVHPSLNTYYWGDQVKVDEMGGACSTHGDMTNAYKLLLENLKGRYHSEDLDVDESIILE